MQKTRIKIMFAIVLTLALTMSALLGGITFVEAAEYETEFYLSFRPNPIGEGQTLLVNLWLNPPIRWDQYLTGIWVNLTKPDGTIVRIGPIETEWGGTTASWFEYTPDQVGTWYLQGSFPGQTVLGNYYKPCISPKIELVVQQDPVSTWAGIPLPTEYWTRPIDAQFSEWQSISGDWLQQNYNASRGRWNPYSTGPNTGHIVWAKEWGIGGLIGGEEDALGYGYGPNNNDILPGAVVPHPDIIMAGSIYARSPEGVHRIDLRTGETQWIKPGIITAGQHSPAVALGFMHHLDAALLSIGTTFTKSYAFSGEKWWTMNNTLGGTYADPYVYSKQGAYLIKWDSTNTKRQMGSNLTNESKTFQDMIVWNVTYPHGAPTVVWGNVGVSLTRNDVNWTNFITGFNTETGAIMWNQTLDTMSYVASLTMCAGYGKVFMAMEDRTWHAYDINTGQKVWASEKAGYPWGAFWAYSSAVGCGNVYGQSYDGIYCFDAETGNTKWVYRAELEYPYEVPYPDSSPFYSYPVIADGKIYVCNNEHSPTNPYYKDLKLHCINATTGEGLWNISMSGAVNSIADGYLLGINMYDSKLYCYSKGPSATQVTASPKASVLGSSVVIEGTVMDISAGTKNSDLTTRFPDGVAAVSDDSMSEWMEHVYMQFPRPEDAVGVEVTISVVDENGNYREIGKTTSSPDGFYSLAWVPDIPGKYMVYAKFAGSESYWPSHAETAFAVDPAPATPAPTQALIQSAADTYLLPGIIAIIVVIAVGFAITILVLRKRP